jgi:hypothetical protein
MKIITMRVSDEDNDYKCLMKVIPITLSDEDNNYESV